MKTLPNHKVILFKLTFCTDSRKAAFAIRNFDSHVSQFNVEFADDSNICSEPIGQKELHLNKKGKYKLTANAYNKTQI